mgnify:CR=1 FL=1
MKENKDSNKNRSLMKTTKEHIEFLQEKGYVIEEDGKTFLCDPNWYELVDIENSIVVEHPTVIYHEELKKIRGDLIKRNH